MSALAGLKAAAAAQLATPQTTITGCLDSPSHAEARIGGPLWLSGWVLTDGVNPPSITVLIDGVEVGTAIADRPREDLRDISPGLRGGGWTCEIKTSDSDLGATLSVVATDDISRMVIDTRRLQAKILENQGNLDLPNRASSAWAGGVVHLAGWISFAGVPADRIEAFVGDEPALPVRRAEPREDVRAMSGEDDPRAIASGFSETVAVPDGWEGRDLPVRVRAYSADGRVWDSQLAHVRIQARPTQLTELDNSSLVRLAAAPAPAPALADRPAGRLRVCVFTHSLNLGGGELYLQELLLRLARGYAVDLLVVSPADGPLREELLDAGVAVHITTGISVDPAHYPGRVAELAALARDWGASVVLANTLGVFPGVDAAIELGLPVVWAIHESFSLPLFSYLNWGDFGMTAVVEARWLRTLQLANTVFEANATLELFASQVPTLRGRRIQYGIDVAEIARYRAEHDRESLRAELGLLPTHTVLLCMGVVQPRKSQLALVLAFAQLAPLFPDARLLLVGDHPTHYAGAVRRAITDLGLSEQVQLIPIQPDTYRWYHAADVLISASDTESLPRSVLEAKAFGLPAMAADVFGLSEVISDGVNGWLCQPRSGSSLVVGLYRALSCSLDERARIAQECLRDSVNHDGSNYAAEYFELMSSLVASADASDQH